VGQAARRLKEAARALGFSAVGIAPPRLPAEEQARFERWLAEGRHGQMDWIADDPAGRCDAAGLLEDAQAVLVAALPHAPELRARPDPQPPAARGYVATYAQAPYDYHRVLAGRLERLAELFADLLPGATARRFCDTSPLLERAFARAAGLGFVGKNTLVIGPHTGSYAFLGGLILDRPLPPDIPGELPSCGTCTRCLEACPTDAFPAPYELDARRCIAYLTIEHRGAYDEALRAGVGTHLFGCDLCQSVCPWNKFAPESDPELAPEDARVEPDLLGLYERFRSSFKGIAKATPWERTGKRGFLRNLATAMGNAGNPDLHRPALEELAAHDDPGVAEHARWALERLGD
jgi:epoxyqueuosine reductase